MTAPDVRPQVVDGRLRGTRCTGCGQPSVELLPRCAQCRGRVEETDFGPDGVIWSATVLRIEVPGRPAPRTLAYVDLVDGPRLLAHVADADTAPAVGTRVRLTVSTEQGDPQVEVCG